MLGGLSAASPYLAGVSIQSPNLWKLEVASTGPDASILGTAISRRRVPGRSARADRPAAGG
jgi:hypothetical protein